MGFAASARCIAAVAIVIGMVLNTRNAAAQDAYVTNVEVDGRAITDQGSAGGTAATGGDLEHTIVCRGGGYSPGPDDSVTVWLELYVENALIAREPLWGYWTVSGQVTGRVRASIRDRRVDCFASSSWGGWASEGGTLLGSGPEVVKISLGAFIPDAWVWNPVNGDRIFEGDGRGFREDAATSRVAQVIQVLNPALSDSNIFAGPHPYTGLTQEYDDETSLVNGQLTSAARNDWTWDSTLKTRWATASTAGLSCNVQRLGASAPAGISRNKVVCEAQANNPLLPYSPDIDYRMEFQLTFGLNKVQYQITGCRDAFPAYEAYLNGQTAYAQPPTGSTWRLFFSCDQSISASGEVR